MNLINNECRIIFIVGLLVLWLGICYGDSGGQDLLQMAIEGEDAYWAKIQTASGVATINIKNRNGVIEAKAKFVLDHLANRPLGHRVWWEWNEVSKDTAGNIISESERRFVGLVDEEKKIWYRPKEGNITITSRGKSGLRLHLKQAEFDIYSIHSGGISLRELAKWCEKPGKVPLIAKLITRNGEEMLAISDGANTDPDCYSLAKGYGLVNITFGYGPSINDVQSMAKWDFELQEVKPDIWFMKKATGKEVDTNGVVQCETVVIIDSVILNESLSPEQFDIASIGVTKGTPIYDVRSSPTIIKTVYGDLTGEGMEIYTEQEPPREKLITK